MDGLCRLCGTEKDNLSNIFDDCKRGKKLASNIQKFLSIEICKDDDLSTTICNTCTDELERTVIFVNRSHQAQEHLKHLHEVILLTKNEPTDSINTAVSCSPSIDYASDGSKLHDDSSFVENDEHDEDEIYKLDFMEPEYSDSEIDPTGSSNRVETFLAGCIRLSNDCANLNLDQQPKLPRIANQTTETEDAPEIDKINNFTSFTNDSNNIEVQDTHDRLTRRNLQKSSLQSTKSNELKATSSEKEATSNSSNCADRPNKYDSIGALRVMLKRIPDSVVSPLISEYQKWREHPADSSFNRLISTDTSKGITQDHTSDSENEQSTNNTSKGITQDHTSDTENKQSFNNTSKGITQDPTSDTENKQSTNKQPNLQCEKCEEDFDTLEKYENHMFEEHPDDRPFPCKLCSSTFRKRRNLNLHLTTIHGEKKFMSCSVCDYVCVRKSRLMNHIKDVHERNLQCSQCNYRTGTKRRLMLHISNQHTPCNLSFVCEICGKTFKRQPTLSAHRKNTHFPEPHQCPNCGVVLPSKSKYYAHYYRCSREITKCKCDICGASYTLKYALIDHINKHLNIRPYVCNICGKSFFQRIRLNSHVSVHRGLQFECNICGKSFNRKGNMKSHQKRRHFL